MRPGEKSASERVVVENNARSIPTPISVPGVPVILAATNTDTAWRFKETKKSGLMGTGGIGFTLGRLILPDDL